MSIRQLSQLKERKKASEIDERKELNVKEKFRFETKLRDFNT